MNRLFRVQPLRLLLLPLLLLLLSSPFSTRAENVLLVIADDLGMDYFEQICPEFYSGGQVSNIAPTLNALCQRAIFFTNAWAYTVCSPTRASMLTGRYGFRNGVTQVKAGGLQTAIEVNELTLPKVLDAAGSGFAHANIGKWHLQSATIDGEYPITMGWDYYYGLLSGAVEDYASWPMTESSRLVDGSIEVSSLQQTQSSYVTTDFSTQAKQWIEQQNTSQTPWFLWLAYTAPHSPFHKPPAELLTASEFESLPESGAPESDYYKAMIYAMDHQLAEVLSVVDLSDTFIVFLGDNGSPGEVVDVALDGKAKGTAYQGGLHVPLMIVPPDNGTYSASKQVTDLVHTVDIFPTILNMAGLDITTLSDTAGPLENVDLDGKSLMAYVTDPALIAASNARTLLYNEMSPTESSGARVVRNQSFKLIRNNTGDQEFYAINCDAGADCINTYLATESTNLLDNTQPTELPSNQLRSYKQLSDHLKSMIDIIACEKNVTDPVGSGCGSLY